MFHVPERRVTCRLRQAAWCAIVSCTVLPCVVTACSRPKNEVVKGFVDESAVPTLRSHDVITLISDSGVTKYRISTKEWLIYDNAQEPYWLFPQGVYVEKFDSVFETEASIVSDTATYLKNKMLWRLDKNVRLENLNGEVFRTEQVFWNQRDRTIYSDSFIHIERDDEVIEGFGFTSNEQMTQYTIRRPTGVFPIPQDSARNAKKKTVEPADQ